MACGRGPGVDGAVAGAEIMAVDGVEAPRNGGASPGASGRGDRLLVTSALPDGSQQAQQCDPETISARQAGSDGQAAGDVQRDISQPSHGVGGGTEPAGAQRDAKGDSDMHGDAPMLPAQAGGGERPMTGAATSGLQLLGNAIGSESRVDLAPPTSDVQQGRRLQDSVAVGVGRSDEMRTSAQTEAPVGPKADANEASTAHVQSGGTAAVLPHSLGAGMVPGTAADADSDSLPEIDSGPDDASSG